MFPQENLWAVRSFPKGIAKRVTKKHSANHVGRICGEQLYQNTSQNMAIIVGQSSLSPGGPFHETMIDISTTCQTTAADSLRLEAILASRDFRVNGFRFAIQT